MVKLLSHPLVRLALLAIAAAVSLRAVFVLLSGWIWGFEVAVPDAAITPWARWAMVDRDGLEPYALFLVECAQVFLTVGAAWLLARLRPSASMSLTAALLAGPTILFLTVPFHPPAMAVHRDFAGTVLVVGAALAAALLLGRVARANVGLPVALAVALIPLCFVPISLPSYPDLSCILIPALRLMHGVAPKNIYFQYDLLPSLLAVGWSHIGGEPQTFWLVGAASYYVTLLGLFALGRRLFSRPGVAAALVVAVVLVRLYGTPEDANIYLQVTPLRLELWLPLLAVVQARGLRHWAAGLVVGLLCFFSRSIGILYVAAYVMAWALDMVARRAHAGRHLGWRAETQAAVRETLPAAVAILVALVASRIVFGKGWSDAVALYRHLGLGMMKTAFTSFYWWLLPLPGLLMGLALRRGAALPPRRAQAVLLTPVLLMFTSFYFFGRSHELNLINLSTSFLFAAFLAADLALEVVAEAAAPRALYLAVLAAPLALVAVTAYVYGGRIAEKVRAQRDLVVGHRSLPGRAVPPTYCEELAHAAGDDRVYLLSEFDYWYYQACAYAPPAYTLPMFLNVLAGPYTQQLNELLDGGYKLALPRGDALEGFLPELLPSLRSLTRTDTPHFSVYSRAAR